MSTINYTLSKGVGTITLNRPSVFHSFNKEMAFAVQEQLKACEEDKSVRVILLTATGKAFCAGQDLAEATAPDGPEMERIVEEHYNPMIRLIRSIEKPIIAGVNGVAAGAGASVALACDIVIAHEKASFIQAFSKIGLIPDSAGTFFLPRLVGMQRAAALMMTADPVQAPEAEQMGMIYKYYSEEYYESKLNKFAEKLAAMPTKGLGLTKRLLNESYSNNLDQQLEREKQVQVEAGKTYDFKEGVTAFLEKRMPEFKGE
jgi:2-(1,2-epoxy-1,2-dihydrophenyl)acetyl-CoA isomerase